MPDILQIILAAIAHYQVSFIDFMSNKKNQKVVPCRRAVWRLGRVLGLSYPQIGHATGNRDHTTVLYGIRKMPLEEVPAELRALAEQLKAAQAA